MSTGGIYQIRNIINDKVYIGHSKNLNKRKISHKSKMKNGKAVNRILKNAVNSYGVENFVFEVIAYIDTTCMSRQLGRKVLTAWEQYYVDIYDPEYNVKKQDVGKISESTELDKKVYCFDLTGNLLGEYESLIEASIKTGVCHADVSACARNRYRKSKNLIFSFSEIIDLDWHTIAPKPPIHTKKVAVFDEQNNFIEMLDGLRHAKRKYGICPQHARNIAECRAFSPWNGLIFKFENELDKIITFQERDYSKQKRSENGRAKKIIQYDLQGNLVKEWGCIRDAEDALNKHKGYIGTKLQKGQSEIDGFVYKYEN